MFHSCLDPLHLGAFGLRLDHDNEMGCYPVADIALQERPAGVATTQVLQAYSLPPCLRSDNPEAVGDVRETDHVQEHRGSS